MGIKKGQIIKHKYGNTGTYRVSYIIDSKVFLDDLNSFWFLDNVELSNKLSHRIHNFFIDFFYNS